MKYEKPAVEVIAFDRNQEFFVFSAAPNAQNAEMDAMMHAITVMGWNSPNDQVVAQKGWDGKWMAWCQFVDGKVGPIYCDRF